MFTRFHHWLFQYKKRYDDRIRQEYLDRIEEEKSARGYLSAANQALREANILKEQTREIEEKIDERRKALELEEKFITEKEEEMRLRSAWKYYNPTPDFEEAENEYFGMMSDTGWEAICKLASGTQRDLSNLSVPFEGFPHYRYLHQAEGIAIFIKKMKKKKDESRQVRGQKRLKEKKIQQDVEEKQPVYYKDIVGAGEPIEKKPSDSPQEK